MKYYNIYLKQGCCIEGEMEDDETKELSNLFETKCKDRKKFKDVEGTLYIDFQEVTAITFNDIEENRNKIGY